MIEYWVILAFLMLGITAGILLNLSVQSESRMIKRLEQRRLNLKYKYKYKKIKRLNGKKVEDLQELSNTLKLRRLFEEGYFDDLAEQSREYISRSIGISMYALGWKKESR